MQQHWRPLAFSGFFADKVKLATSAPQLRPCEHQVAGHLFEDGKAGSLIDDRGHFYKPLQHGPRGDREHAFYEAVAATLRAEEAAAADARSLSRNGSCSAPRGCSPGGDGGASGTCRPTSTDSEPSSPHAPLPWRHRQLLKLFPSFREPAGEPTGPIAVMQRDELGLLSARGAAPPGDPFAPAPGAQHLDLDAGGQEQQQGREWQQRWHEQQQQQQQQQQPAGPAEHVEGELAALQLGRSPDSDECGELTGRSLMQAFHDGPSSHDCGGSVLGSPAAPAEQRSAAAGLDAEQQQQQQRRRPATAGPATSGGSSSRACPASAGPRRAATSAAEQDQAAALLGQPVYDVELNSPRAAPPRPRPPRSCTPPDPLHHASPAWPLRQAAGQRQCASAAAAAANGAAAGPADGSAQRAGAELSPQPSRTAARPQGEQQQHDHQHQQEQQQQEQHHCQQQHDGDLEREAQQLAAAAAFPRLPFSVRNAPLLRVIPRYYGVAEHADGRRLLELEDLAAAYRRPCIIDIKVGHRTWYPQADPAYIERCREKDESTTQAALGFKICGMQVFRHGAGGYWRASKRWCKTLPVELVDKALLSFAHNEHGLRPADVYGGPGGALSQLEALLSWFEVQTDFHFYSSSVLLLYEGSATSPAEAKVRVRLVDFAHTFAAGGAEPDHNFSDGLRALLGRLRGLLHAQLARELT